MLLTLSARALKNKLAPGAKPALKLTDLPTFARNELGLTGMVMFTDLLAGQDRQGLSKVLEAADKAGCPCLVLIEPNPLALADSDEVKVQAALERCMRIAQAAAWLGCAAFSIPVIAKTEEDLIEAAFNLKPISRRAEKLELNMCIQPCSGATDTPEAVTDLLKKIGGFRVGTLPDCGQAMKSGDAAAYLRRLAPYASAILMPVGIENQTAKFVAQKKKPAKVKAAVEDDEDDPEKPKLKVKGKKAKPTDGAASAAAEAVMSAISAKTTPATSGVMDFGALLDVLLTVGYDGPLALDYVGHGDPVAALKATRDAIIRETGLGPEEEDETLDDLLIDLPENTIKDIRE